MRLFSLLTLSLVPLIAAQSSQRPIQVYLHPVPTAPSHYHSAPTLSADQAKGVLAHHLGDTIADDDEIPADEGLWGHLLGSWANTKTGGKARVVVIEGGVSPQDILPTTFSSSPSFYVPEGSSARSLLAPYLQSASHLLSHILDSFPSLAKGYKDTFELSGTKAAAALSHELSCFAAFVDSIPWTHHQKHSYPWEAISISSLGQVDRDEEVWDTGRQVVKAGLEALTTPSSPPLILVIMPLSSAHLISRAETPIQRRANSTLAAACYSSNETCSDSTSCYGRGSCALKSSSGDDECWGCKCASGYAGVECQKVDYSVPFVILIFSSILLFAMLGGSIALLYTVGETKLPSTLTLAIGGQMKRD